MIIVCICCQTSKIYKISRLKISYANCFCPNLEIWVKIITLTCLPSADWCCREPIVASPNKGDKKVDPGTTPWVCPCLWSKAWSDSKSRRDKWVLTPYMYMYIDTLMYGHPASRLAFHLLDFGKTLWESSKIFVEHGLHVIGVQFLNPGLTIMRLIQWPLLRPLFYQQMNACTQTSKYTLKRSSYSPKFLNYLTPLKLPKTSCSTELLKRGGVGWGTADFKWQGWSKDFFGFEIFDSKIFLGRKIWQGFFLVSFILISRDFGGYSKQSEDMW